MQAAPRIAIFLATALGLAAIVAFRSGNAESPVPSPQPQPVALQAELKPAPSTPIAEKKAELGDEETWQHEWDAVIERALSPGLLSSEVSRYVKPFCPRFNAMSVADKRAYWAYFFQALSGAEAGLKPTSNVQHTEPQVAVMDGVSHRMVRSEGLLQLTYEDARRYGCDFDWESDKHLAEDDPEKTILQPENNLLCGVKILVNQLIDRHQPLLSKTSYWSTLRPGWPGYNTFLHEMSNVPEACGRMQHKAPTATNASAAKAAAAGQ
jgi:hypothetical protein